MARVDPAIVSKLRGMADKGCSAAQIVTELNNLLPSSDRNKVTLILYLREAFCLSLQEASPVAGWGVDNSGEIKDERLNELVLPAMMNHRNEWCGE